MPSLKKVLKSIPSKYCFKVKDGHDITEILIFYIQPTLCNQFLLDSKLMLLQKKKKEILSRSFFKIPRFAFRRHKEGNHDNIMPQPVAIICTEVY